MHAAATAATIHAPPSVPVPCNSTSTPSSPLLPSLAAPNTRNMQTLFPQHRTVQQLPMSPRTAGTRSRSRKSRALADSNAAAWPCPSPASAAVAAAASTTAATSAALHSSSHKSTKRTVMGLWQRRGRPEPGEGNVMVALRCRHGGTGCSSNNLNGKQQLQQPPGCSSKRREMRWRGAMKGWWVDQHLPAATSRW